MCRVCTALDRARMCLKVRVKIERLQSSRVRAADKVGILVTMIQPAVGKEDPYVDMLQS